MRLFSHADRPVHLGPFPMERLGRQQRPDLAALTSDGLITYPPEPGSLAVSISEFLCALDAVREGPVATAEAVIPSAAQDRSQHLKAAGYFLDAALMGIAPLTEGDFLPRRHQHPDLEKLTFETVKDKLRLRFNPAAVIEQMETAIELAAASIAHHRFAIVIVNDYPKDPDPDEPGAPWINNMQQWRAAVRAAETGVVLANYLRILGYSARSHSATTTDVHLHRLAVSAGLALPMGAKISNPFIGDRFDVAVVTTDMELAADLPLRRQYVRDRLRAKGLAWWTGAAAPRSARTAIDMTGRRYADSRYPTETLKRVDKPTTFIDEDRIPRVPKSSEMFLRAAFGDIGKPAQEASIDGFSVAKAPLAGALRLALNVFSLMQRGHPASRQKGNHDDPIENAATIKAVMHFLGADIAGVTRAPDWVWYSHRQDGSPMPVAHPNAVAVMIDQGHETMEGASGDDWISSAQSMRTYMRAALVCGVVGQHLRRLGYEATAHSAADSDVIQTPIVLLAGLGEVSRIGDTILNPFLGPRLKTGILTTDFPMQPDKPIDFGLQAFCGACNKCARECPSGAISSGPKVIFNGYEIWKPDTVKCTQYRTTNMGGSMCGRCMKTCPWNLAGLVTESPFRWAAMKLPSLARAIAWLDDALNRGTINPRKKWWWDIARNSAGKIEPAAQTNVRDLNKHLTLDAADQTLAMFPIDLQPPPLPMPFPLDREAGIAAYDGALSAQAYKARLAAGNSEELVRRRPAVPSPPPVIVAGVRSRRKSSADGKIDILEITTRDGQPLPAFTAGAHIDITVTPQFIRQFSLAGDPQDRSKYLIGVLREDDGRGGSTRLHRLLHEGAPVIVSQPRNHFPISPDQGRHLLLAGGIGVTPLIAMGHQLAREGRPFTLYYKARTRAQAAFIEELQTVSWRDHVRFHFSDESRLDIRTVLQSYQAGDHCYTCGPSAFMDAVFDVASTNGWPAEALHREYFSVPDEPDRENYQFSVELASSGAVINVPADESITDVLEAAGRPVDVKCSDGLCGVCATSYLDGEVDHRDYVLSKAQRAHRMILCCSRAARASGLIRLDL